MHAPDNPTLVLNPPDDEAFVSFARRELDGAVISPTEFQRRLRVRYPGSLVRPRELSGERSEIWYVYRDGHWTRRV